MSNHCVTCGALASFSRKLSLGLLVFSLQFSMPVMAQVGGIGMLPGAGGLAMDSNLSLGGGAGISSGAPAVAQSMVQSKQTALNPASTPPRPVLSTKPLPPQEPNEFQDFLSASVGKKLPIYGLNLFESTPDTFAPLDNVPVTPDYLIGPGDEIVINAWGGVDVNMHVVVSRNGTIELPKVGTVNVAGVRYQDLRGYLKNAIGRVFRNFDLSVSMGTLRSIQVFVVGQARQPGVYTVSSLSTLVNTLFASGGPSSNGSMRHIQVKRNGQIMTEFDLYDLLLKGDKTRDVALLPGDVIFIPPVGRLVAIYGGVNNAAIYELKDDKTTLADLLELAGGLTTTAAGQKVLLERIQDRAVRKVEEFALNNEGLARAVRDGDLIQVFNIDVRFDNAVTLRGNVSDPGRYPWKEGMRVRDLIPNMESLITSEYWVKQNSKGNVNNVNSAGEMRLHNEVKHSVAEINWDYAVVERLNKDKLQTTLIPFNLGKAIRGDEEHNLQLQAGDSITIFSKDDIQVPAAKRSVYVRLEGEINNAGVYQVMPGETLRQLVARVGGLSPNAFLFGAEFDRESVRLMQQQKLKEMTDRMRADINRNLSLQSQHADVSGSANATALQSLAVAQNELVDRMSRIQATGRVVLEIPQEGNQIKDLPDIALEDGDRLVIPPRQSVVSVMGMVYNENAFLFRSGKTVEDYLRQAGGPTRDADVARIYVVRADGSVIGAKSSGVLFNSLSSMEVMPGATIVVPESLDKFELTRELKDWSQIIYQFALGVASIKVLKL